MKVLVSTTIPVELAQRVQDYAETSGLSKARVIAQCIELGLPELLRKGDEGLHSGTQG